MKILYTFIWPIRIWQFCALTPLSVSSKTAWPSKNAFLKGFAVVSLVGHLICFAFSMYFNKSYIDWTQKQFAVYHDIFVTAAAHVVVCAVVIESIVKINLQIELLERLNRIDYAIQYKTHIKIDYKKCQQQNTLGTMAWIFWHLFCGGVILFHYYWIDDLRNLLGWAVYCLPLIVYSLQYQRMILYVHQIGQRFRMLNQYLLDNFMTSISDGSAWSLILAIKGYTETEDRQHQIDQTESRFRLFEIRNVYQQLAEASDVINVIFGYSLPMCIAVDSHKMLSNIYWLFVVWLNHEGSGAAIAPALWLTLNLLHLLALTYICQTTSKEVTHFICRL